mgnify:CR=1 FL=1
MAEITNGADVTTTNKAEVQTNPDVATLQAELEKFRIENEKLRAAQTNASADASKYKRELASRMTEQEKAAAETKELIETLKAENEALKRSQALAENEAGFIGAGFDGETAKKAAEAFFDKDFKAFIKTLGDFITAHDKALNADAIRNTPKPGTGNTGAPSITQEQFDKMGYSERLKIYNEQPELYKTLTQK